MEKHLATLVASEANWISLVFLCLVHLIFSWVLLASIFLVGQGFALFLFFVFHVSSFFCCLRMSISLLLFKIKLINSFSCSSIFLNGINYFTFRIRAASHTKCNGFLFSFLNTTTVHTQHTVLAFNFDNSITPTVVVIQPYFSHSLLSYLTPFIKNLEFQIIPKQSRKTSNT